ncbi:LacI family DNA-binding transcriptional regulator [Streptomyces sp. NPDC096013]|uniref:LacI family DNA-binding transcriptional regulator n=1 Tax=Streptomyces sp. NPDC096013 TaxID=3366069 RepID=UPI0037F8D4BC
MTDVAREAGVFLVAVSPVLDQPHIVAAPTRQRVQSAIDRISFVRSKHAPVLKDGSSLLIAILVPDLTNPFYVALVRAAVQKAHRTWPGILVCNENAEVEERSRSLALRDEH